MSYEEVHDGDVCAVVTFLEMTGPPDDEAPRTSPLSLIRHERPDLDMYRDLFRAVGGPWLWFSRLLMTDEKLAAIIHDPEVELFVVQDSRRRVGMLELDFRVTNECELAYVGLLPDHAGQGHGRWLLGEALRLAWRADVKRVHVHTCTLDHPAALPAYQRAGFRPYKRAIERFRDPRLLGILPRSAAPQVPLIGTDGAASRPAA